MANMPQMSGEPEHAYLALCEWVRYACPPLPEFCQTAEHSGASIRTWARRWDWQARVDASPYAAQLARVQAGIERRIAETAAGMPSSKWFESLARRASELYSQRVEMAEAIGAPVEITPSDQHKLMATAKLAHEMERLDADLSTSNVAIASQTATVGGIVWTDERLAALTTDELDALALVEAAEARLASGDDEDGDAP